jgi:hypothetical protein
MGKHDTTVPKSFMKQIEKLGKASEGFCKTVEQVKIDSKKAMVYLKNEQEPSKYSNTKIVKIGSNNKITQMKEQKLEKVCYRKCMVNDRPKCGTYKGRHDSKYRDCALRNSKICRQECSK